MIVPFYYEVLRLRIFEQLGYFSSFFRIQKYEEFKDFKYRILVATDLVGRGIDIERVNIVINYDFPQPRTDKAVNSAVEASSEASDQYLHRVGRAGRFGTKGLAISFTFR